MTYGYGPVAWGELSNFAAPFFAAASGGGNVASPWYAKGDWTNFAVPFAAWGSGGLNFAGIPYGAGKGCAW